jgi:hypothetical protein
VTSTAAGILRTPLCPVLPPDFAGVRIALAPLPERSSRLVVHGAYRLPWADAEAIEPSRHRALVLVVTSAHLHFVATPFRAQILFADDEQETRGGPAGYFSLDVFALMGADPPGEYHLLVSLGPYTSNVETVTIT